MSEGKEGEYRAEKKSCIKIQLHDRKRGVPGFFLWFKKVASVKINIRAEKGKKKKKRLYHGSESVFFIYVFYTIELSEGYPYMFEV